MELLARFELAAVLPRNFISWEPYDLTIEIDEVASSIIAENKNPSFRMGYGAASQI